MIFDCRVIDLFAYILHTFFRASWHIESINIQTEMFFFFNCSPLFFIFAIFNHVCASFAFKSTKFNEMWQKLVSKLELGKKLIMDLIEQSVAAYEQREELCNKIQSLEIKGQNEQNLHLQVSTL